MRTNILGALAIVATGCSDPATFDHFYSQGSAVVVGDSLRFAMTGTDPNGQIIETTTVRLGDEPAAVTAVLVDGAPIDSPAAQLSAIGDRAYLAWSEVGDGTVRYRGGPLAADGTIEPSAIVDLGEGRVELRRVGDRYLALQLPEPGTALPAFGALRGTYILADGRVDGSVEIGTVDSNATTMTNDATGAAGLWAMAFLNTNLIGEDELKVGRVLADGTVLDGDGILIARSVDAVGTRPGKRSIATTSDGGVLVIYELVKGSALEIHAARIARTGELVDQIVALPSVPQLVGRGDQILALSRIGPASEIESRILDVNGTVLSGPVASGATFDPEIIALATTAGFVVIQGNNEIRATELAPDGQVVSSTVVASPYRVELD